MSKLRRRNNKPEMAVRRLLYARGLRYRVCFRVPGQRRRTIDIAFVGARFAIYIDGCFWHGCPEHAHLPKANAGWWTRKIAMNKARDAAVNEQLAGLGWTVLRVWEHENPHAVVSKVVAALEGTGKEGPASRGERDTRKAPSASGRVHVCPSMEA
ncbi:very short patch repair endonuclease [Blastococcus sp. CCUG 61487]|uniref:very short patch repair endonuclease n=1 Tax=Blastococcus sp. CCUG 61487 TaxID=1840703 RepID=UPI0010C1160D|nr:very short patch repair endonuclease [Blastococcus sp. CCUG 61487]